MKVNEIKEHIVEELKNLSPDVDYGFSISSEWKGRTTKLKFSIYEKKYEQKELE